MTERASCIMLCLALPLAVVGLGCKEEPKKPITASAAASADPAAMDPKLREALGAASARPTSAKDGPPPNGVFDPGMADAAHAKGAPVKIQLGSEGAEPRTAFGMTPEFKANATLSVSLRTGPRSAFPSVDLTLAFSPDKGSTKDSPVIVAHVQKAVASREQPGTLPDGVNKQLAVLKDSELRILTAVSGGASDIQLAPGKSTSQELEPVLVGAADALMALDVPFPAKPVGVGAAWVAESRNKYGPVDVIAYRMYQIKGIVGDDLTLSVQVREYAASGETTIAGVPKGSGMQQFESGGEGEITVHKGETLARKGNFKFHTVMAFQGQGQQAGRMLSLQLDNESKIAR